RGIQCMLTDAGYAALQTASHTHVSSVRRRLVDVVTDEELTTRGTAFTKRANAIEGVVEPGAEARRCPWEPERDDVAGVEAVAAGAIGSARGRHGHHIRAAEAAAGEHGGEPASARPHPAARDCAAAYDTGANRRDLVHLVRHGQVQHAAGGLYRP